MSKKSIPTPTDLDLEPLFEEQGQDESGKTAAPQSEQGLKKDKKQDDEHDLQPTGSVNHEKDAEGAH